MRADIPHGLDVAEVVLVAAAVSALDPAVVLASADLGVLVGATERARAATSASAAAGELLVAVAAGRPFPVDNLAIAWCVAAHVVALDGDRLDLEPSAAADLLADAARGFADERVVADALALATRSRPSRWRRARTWLTTPTSVAPPLVAWSCPVCGAVVSVAPGRSSVFLARPHPRDLVVDCARSRRVHDADGVSIVDRNGAGTELERRLAVLRADHRIASSVLERA